MDPTSPASDGSRSMGPAAADVETLDSFGDVDGSLADELRALAGAPSRSVPLSAGVRVGAHFEVERVLGKGGMGIVYLARDLELDRDVALKLHAGEFDEKAVARLQAEARAMAQLNHPNVLAVHEVGAHEGQVYIAVEYVRGVTARAWRDQSSRSWTEVLALYTQAARGLAAAHEAGLVHRDFKPENVLVGVDGRVRVADFGLARVSGNPSLVHTAPDGVSEVTRSARRETLRKVAGTPAYMAPEQFSGAAVDASVDQYAWGATVFEALYGVRPYGERPSYTASHDDLASVDGRRAPGWVRRIVERAAALDPAQRYENLGALLEDLERGHRRRRQRRLSTVAAVALVAAGTGGLTFGRAAVGAPCEDAAAPMDALWTAARRERTAAAFVAADPERGQASWQRTADQIDAYAAAWGEARRRSCEATRVTGTQSERLLERSMQCLDRRASQLEALLRVFDTADDKTVEQASTAADALPGLTVCTDPAALAAVVAPPQSDDDRRQTEEIRARLDRARALTTAGSYAEGAETTRAAVAEAEALGYAPLTADALIDLARSRLTPPDERRELLERAYRLSRSVGAETSAVQAALRLAGEASLSREARQLWAMLARTEFERRAAEPESEIDLERAEGRLLLEAGSYDEGVVLLHRAVERSLELRGDNLQTAAARLTLGAGLDAAGKSHEAIEVYGLALAANERVLGGDHIAVANLLQNRGLARSAVGEYGAAVEDLTRAERIIVAGVGLEHPTVFGVQLNLGIALTAAGRHAEAIEVLDGAHARLRARSNERDPDLALVLNALGYAELMRGESAAALDHYERALALNRKILESPHPEIAVNLSLVGGAHVELGQFDLALRVYREGLDVVGQLDIVEHPLVFGLTLGLAKASFGAGEFQPAVDAATRALDVADRVSVEPHRHEETRFLLARALAALGQDPERADALAREARDNYATLDPERSADVQRWLTARGAQGGPGDAPR